MLPGFQRGDRHVGVKPWRQADVNHVKIRIGNHFAEVAIRGDARQVHLRSRRPEIPFDAAPIARQSLFILFAKRANLRPRRLAIGQKVNHADKPDPRDADSKHFCNPEGCL